MNAEFSSVYRLYSDEIPTFLHNRPREFVSHVCKRWETAKDTISTDITVVDMRTFNVRSLDSTNNYYEVYFGNDDDKSMPYCRCYDWKKFHWICKHFCAVFQQVPDCGWDKLCSEYRLNPQFIIDSDVIPRIDVSSMTTSLATAVSALNNDQLDEFNSEGNVSLHDGNLSTECLAVACRDKLHNLVDLTYLSSDIQSLSELYTKLGNIHNWFVSRLPSDDGILLTNAAPLLCNFQQTRKRNSCSTKAVPAKRSRIEPTVFPTNKHTINVPMATDVNNITATTTELPQFVTATRIYQNPGRKETQNQKKSVS